MMSDRVHALQPEAAPGPTPDPPESPRSSVFSSQNILPKPGPEPVTYVIQVPMDLVLRGSPEGNASRAKAYARRITASSSPGSPPSSSSSPSPPASSSSCSAPRVPHCSVDALSVASFDLSAAAVAPVFDAIVRADNPNRKVGIYYRDGSDITVTYGGVTLCSGAWPAFYQPPRNVTVFVTALEGSGIRPSSAIQEELMTAEREGQVPLEIAVKVPVRIRFGAVTSWTITVTVGCDVTVDDLTESARIVSKKCHVEVKLLKFPGI